MAAQNAESDERSQVKQKDSDLVDCHAQVMNAVESLLGQMKPLAMQLEHPTMGEPKGEEPPEQDDVVEEKTPKQEVA
jgi:hypothetical protein